MWTTSVEYRLAEEVVKSPSAVEMRYHIVEFGFSEYQSLDFR